MLNGDAPLIASNNNFIVSLSVSLSPLRLSLFALEFGVRDFCVRRLIVSRDESRFPYLTQCKIRYQICRRVTSQIEPKKVLKTHFENQSLTNKIKMEVTFEMFWG